MSNVPPPPPMSWQPQHAEHDRYRRRTAKWIVIAVVIALAVILGGCGLVWALLSMAGLHPASILTGGSPLAPPAAVHLGTPLTWRELQPVIDSPFGAFGDIYLGAEVACGDFDGDGGDEIIVSGAMIGFTLFELDGSIVRDEQYIDFDRLTMRTWDFGDDGNVDLIGDAYDMTTCGVFDVQGNRLATLDGQTNHFGAMIRDFDGDGLPDLQLEHYPGETLIYDCQGQLIWQEKLPPNEYNPTFGDLDGDGAVEMILLSRRSGQLSVHGLTHAPATFPAWQSYHWPRTCADVDGDGIDEVFASNCGYLNVVSGQFTVLDYPAVGQSEDALDHVLLADLDQDGDGQLIARGVNNYCLNAGLYMFDTQGTCTYYEEMGEPIEEFFIAHDANQQPHLVVMTDSRLLITP